MNRTSGRALRLALVVLLPCLSSSADEPAGQDPEFAMTGTWTWRWQDAEGETHRHVLEVEGKAPKYAARERFDDLEPVRVEDLKIVGKQVEFTVRRGDRISRYEGTFADSEVINGKVTVTFDGQPQQFGWTARKEPTKP